MKKRHIYICKIDVYINIFTVVQKQSFSETCVFQKKKQKKKKSIPMKSVNICKIDVYINIFDWQRLKTNFFRKHAPEKSRKKKQKKKSIPMKNKFDIYIYVRFDEYINSLIWQRRDKKQIIF